MRLCLAFLLTFVLQFASGASAVKVRAFATSVADTGRLQDWTAAGGQTGLAAGDKICQTLAAAASPPLPSPTFYRAWLSGGGTDAYCHIQGFTGLKSTECNGSVSNSRGPWYLVDGVTPFTGDLAELTDDGVVYSAVYYDESGNELGPNEEIWTGTLADGRVSNTNNTCIGWTAESGSDFGVIGHVRAGASSWTQAGFGSACNVPRHLLCLEGGTSEPVSIPWQPAAIVFLTSVRDVPALDDWQAAHGLHGWQAADAICQTLAGNAHLPAPSSFMAWVSDGSVSIADRISWTGSFRRVDHVEVATSLTLLVNSSVLNGIYVDEHGNYDATNALAWTGTLADGSRSNQHCSNWSIGTNAASGTYGRAALGRTTDWTERNASTCQFNGGIYCFGGTEVVFWDGFELTGDPSRWSSAKP